MSNEPTIEQKNKAIAVFMGWEFIKGDPNHKCNFCFAGDEPCIPALDRFVKEKDMRVYYEFKYHSSWDGLMPVIEKINQVWARSARSKQKQIEETYRAIQNRILLCSLSETIEHVYQFIQWYNNQSTTTNEA